jgi:hypothetical protein
VKSNWKAEESGWPIFLDSGSSSDSITVVLDWPGISIGGHQLFYAFIFCC